MVPQFMMMSSWHLNNTHLAIIFLQAFSAFGVFMMKQFYEAFPPSCARLPVSTVCPSTASMPHHAAAFSARCIDAGHLYLRQHVERLPRTLIYLTKTELKTIQIGLRMFISQYSAEYGLIMAASVVALIPVLIVFLSLQKYFVQGVASSGLKG
mgnify:CR=1 FL=1